jgi:hypothetical protein
LLGAIHAIDASPHQERCIEGHNVGVRDSRMQPDLATQLNALQVVQQGEVVYLQAVRLPHCNLEGVETKVVFYLN